MFINSIYLSSCIKIVKYILLISWIKYRCMQNCTLFSLLEWKRMKYEILSIVWLSGRVEWNETLLRFLSFSSFKCLSTETLWSWAYLLLHVFLVFLSYRSLLWKVEETQIENAQTVGDPNYWLWKVKSLQKMVKLNNSNVSQST